MSLIKEILELIGIYTFFYKDLENVTYSKLGRQGERKGKKTRLEEHLTSCRGMTLGPFFPCLDKETVSLEETMLDLMREHFECVDDNTETFIIGHNLTTDEAVELIESILTPEILETMREIKRPKIKKINYEVGTLYGKEDIRDLRPTCDFLTGEDAQITTEAGAGERYRSVYMYMDKYLKKLDRPIKMSASAKAHKIIRMAKHTAKREIEIEQLKEKEKQGQGVLF